MTDKEVEFIIDCLYYYLSNEEQFVSYDEHKETQIMVNRIEDKLHIISELKNGSINAVCKKLKSVNKCNEDCTSCHVKKWREIRW